MKKLNQKKVDELIKNITDDDKEVTWIEGQPRFKSVKKKKRGKRSKSKGNRFELKVRRDLEEKGRFVDKWNNNVDLEKNELVIAKRKYNPYSRVMTLGTGFPDFITIKPVADGLYSVIGVEVKVNGVLSREEKEKCRWYLNKKIFSEIWIAKEKRDGRKIIVEYVNFDEKYSLPQ